MIKILGEYDLSSYMKYPIKLKFLFENIDICKYD